MLTVTPFVTRHRSAMMRVTALLVCVITTVMVLSQTVFARNTYVITDGDQVTYHSTYATDPAQILVEAGVQLSEDDIYTTNNEEGVEAITVRRGMTVNLYYCGQEYTICSYGETVGQLLERLDITLRSNEVLAQSADEMVYDGMDVIINRLSDAVRYYNKTINYTTIYCYNPTLDADYREVVREGTPGQMLCIAEAKLVDGQEMSRNLTDQIVITEPVSEIVVVGTGENPKGHWQTPAVGDGVLVTYDGQILFFSKTIQSEATAYHMSDEGCDEITATGTYARVGAIAVDPKVIPYFTKMYIISNDGRYVYGFASAEDCGGAINGTRIDLYYDTVAECFQFGRRNCTVFILE